MKPRAARIEIVPEESSAVLVRRIIEQVAVPRRVFFHVDLTDQRKLPEQRDLFVRALHDRGIQTWNSALPYLSKGSVQRWNRRLNLPDTLADRIGPSAQLLIVKTQHNCFGATECQLTAQERAGIGYPSIWSTPIDQRPDYPVLKRTHVPSSWWTSPKLEIERYIQSAEGDFFRIFLFGENVVILICRSLALIKRPENSSASEYLLLERRNADSTSCARLIAPRVWTAFQNAVKFAHAIGLDYGAIDMVADRRTPYIVDVNPTPWWGRLMTPEIRKHLLRGETLWRREV